MTYQDILSLFGKREDPSVLVFKLTVSFPRFCYRDLLEIFQVTANHYRKADDSIKPPTFNTPQSHIFFSSGPSRYYSTAVLQNLYEIMFNTNLWDDIVLTADFIQEFGKLVSNLVPIPSVSSFSREKRWDNIQLDRYDNFAEFEDKLKSKALLRSGL